jgi:AcrR family transcriptional regulator
MEALREKKKRETRQRISDVATALFFTRGFDAVTVEEVAVAAKVSKMTVFNYFARKEELILDREDDLKMLPFRQAIRDRSPGQSPVDALRALVRAMSAAKQPLCHVSSEMVAWWQVVDASPALRARLRELADEATELMAHELGGAHPDGAARLAAGLIVLTLRTARQDAIALLVRGASAKKANAAFLALMEHGLAAAGQLATTSHGLPPLLDKAGPEKAGSGPAKGHF